jgi:hypothetical protein
MQERAYIHAPWLSGSDDRDLGDRLDAARRIVHSLQEAEAQLHRNVGPRWGELPTEGPGELQALLAAARATIPRPTIDGEATSVTVDALRQTFVQAREVLEECAGHIDVLATAFDQPKGTISFGRALELGRLAGFAHATDRPEAHWFTPADLEKARDAIQHLRPLLASVRTLADALNVVFKREVLTLDLETLCVRFGSSYRSVFRWFNPEYRRDRRALKSVIRSGRVHREELARLPAALEWQRAVSAFEAAAANAAEILGHFLRGEESDLDAAERGAAVAEAACNLAGAAIGPETLARQLARDADPLGPGVAQAALRIVGLEARWGALGAAAAQLRTLPLAHAIDGARQADAAMLRVVKQLHVVDAIAAKPVRLDDAEKWLRLRSEIEEAERDLRDRAAADVDAFGPAWNGRATEWDRLAAGIAWAAAVKAALGGPVSRECATRLATMPVPEPALGDPLGRWATSNGKIAAQFDEPRAEEVRRQLRGPFEAAEAVRDALITTVDDVGEWHAHAQAIAGLAEQGPGEAGQFCLSKRVAAEHVREVLERALCEAWTDDVLKHDPRLSPVRADDRDALAKDFSRLDRELIRLAAREAIAACSQMRPSNLHGAAGIILNEANKLRRHMPVRNLLREAREVAQAIKPCFMMSPLSVSQFLPPNMVFDVVIFDEASQVRPADAISSVVSFRQACVN